MVHMYQPLPDNEVWAWMKLPDYYKGIKVGTTVRVVDVESKHYGRQLEVESVYANKDVVLTFPENKDKTYLQVRFRPEQLEILSVLNKQETSNNAIKPVDELVTLVENKLLDSDYNDNALDLRDKSCYNNGILVALDVIREYYEVEEWVKNSKIGKNSGK